jgi:hypothetical protein
MIRDMPRQWTSGQVDDFFKIGPDKQKKPAILKELRA